MNDNLVEVDARGRVSLARFVPEEQRYRRYFITVEPDFTIILTPAVAVRASQTDDAA